MNPNQRGLLRQKRKHLGGDSLSAAETRDGWRGPWLWKPAGWAQTPAQRLQVMEETNIVAGETYWNETPPREMALSFQIN